MEGAYSAGRVDETICGTWPSVQIDMGLAKEEDFTPEELEANLEVGFRGRPAIGSAVMSQIDLDNLDGDAWRQLIDSIRLDIGGKSRFPKIFLFGSIFGGDGRFGHSNHWATAA